MASELVVLPGSGQKPQDEADGRGYRVEKKKGDRLQDKGLFINYVIKIGGRGGYPKKIIIYYV